MSRVIRIRTTCTCPGSPEVETSVPSPEDLRALAPCPNCGVRAPVHRESLTKDGGLLGCLACEHPELFTRKSMPPALGILVVVVAAVLAPFTMYLSLVVAAVIDLVLFGIVPDVVTCYVCGAEHRGFQREPRHPRFDREIAERLRFGARAVMGRPMREGGTANAPDPEH